MTLYQKVRSVEKLFNELDARISDFQEKSGLHCLAGCGKCCYKPDIEATVLEFLPLAYHYYKSGIADLMYEKLKLKNLGICHVFVQGTCDTNQGRCSEYVHRGLVCRLFGFSARKNKEGINQLYTCRLIKEDQKEIFIHTSEEINSAVDVPMVKDYYQHLAAIDPGLGMEYYLINEAAWRAIGVVKGYYSYRLS